MFPAKGLTWLNNQDETYNVHFYPEKSRNQYICIFDDLPFKGYGDTAQQAIYDVHRQFYNAHPELKTWGQGHNNAH